MSFKINWPKFSPEFIEKAKEQVTVALNKGEKPAKIVDEIVVKDLNMGTKPPELEILEIGDLAEERFRGIFKLTYGGDASVVLLTKVQANPLIEPKVRPVLGHQNGILAANRPLVVPMQLQISNLKLRGIVVLVIDKQRGVTLVFKNDPLEKVDVNSTFDNIPNIRRFLQKQIEQQLRKLFQDDLPQLIHNLSLLRLGQNQEGGKDTVAESLFDPNDEYSPAFQSEIGYLVNRPHHQKWSGNDPVDGYCSDFDAPNGYVLYRGLVTSYSSESSDIGLHRLFETDRTKTVSDIEWRSRILWPWLKGRDQSNLELRNKTVLTAMQLMAPKHHDAADLSPSFLPRSGLAGTDDDDDSNSVRSSKSAPILHTSSHELRMTNNERSQLPRNSASEILVDKSLKKSDSDSNTRSRNPSFRRPQSPYPVYSQSVYTPPPAVSPPSPPPEHFTPPNRIVLQPSDNPVAAHLANLLTSNHTIFPFTHTPEHFTYRSFPPSKLSQSKQSVGTSAATTLLETNSQCKDLHLTPPDYVITPHTTATPSPSHRKKSGMRRMRVPLNGGVMPKLTQSSSTTSLTSMSQRSSNSASGVSATSIDDDDGQILSCVSEGEISKAETQKVKVRSERAKSVGSATVG